MASVAVLHHLRERSHTFKTNCVTTKGKHQVPKVIADRIKHLRSLDQLNVAGLADELAGILELATEISTPKVKTRTLIMPVKVQPEVKEFDTPKAEAKQNALPKFCAEFLELLASGDYSALAPSGLMSPAMFKGTRDYIFCTVKKVNGKTVQASFISNPLKRCDALLAPGISVSEGYAVILRTGLITDVIEFHDDPNFIELARTFNQLAARSKV